MKEIALSKRYTAIVSDEDFEWLNKYKWHTHHHGKTVYAVRVEIVNGKRHKVRMHREILGAKDGMVVDHKDMNGLNNQRSNIRICTIAQNVMNRGIQKNNKSGIPGVFWRKECEKFRVYIRKDRKLIHVGHFSTITEAVSARNEALSKYHGEFAHYVA